MSNDRWILCGLLLGLAVAFALHPLRTIHDVRQGFADHFDPGPQPPVAADTRP